MNLMGRKERQTAYSVYLADRPEIGDGFMVGPNGEAKCNAEFYGNGAQASAEAYRSIKERRARGRVETRGRKAARRA